MFHFTIRDVLWLTVVVALACGWWLDNRILDNVRRHALVLRTNLNRARWHYAPIYISEKQRQTSDGGAVEWDLVDAPIP